MLHAVATGTALLASLAATIAVPSSSVGSSSVPSSSVGSSRVGSSPPPGKVAMKVVSANGSGCPRGSADVSVSPGNRSFKVTYRKFTASSGPGAAAIGFRKNCQLALEITGPKGWTWAVSRVVASGSASLRSGATGIQQSSYYWSGGSQTVRVSNAFTGPVSGRWERSNKVPQKSLGYLPCGQRRNLNVNLELRVNAGSATGRNLLTMDSTSGSVFHVVWRKC
jgi:Domain of unknown function (DUF4360)